MQHILYNKVTEHQELVTLMLEGCTSNNIWHTLNFWNMQIQYDHKSKRNANCSDGITATGTSLN